MHNNHIKKTQEDQEKSHQGMLLKGSLVYSLFIIFLRFSIIYQYNINH